MFVFNGFQVSLSENESENFSYRVIEIQQIRSQSSGRKRLNQKLEISCLLRAGSLALEFSQRKKHYFWTSILSGLNLTATQILRYVYIFCMSKVFCLRSEIIKLYSSVNFLTSSELEIMYSRSPFNLHCFVTSCPDSVIPSLNSLEWNLQSYNRIQLKMFLGCPCQYGLVG